MPEYQELDFVKRRKPHSPSFRLVRNRVFLVFWVLGKLLWVICIKGNNNEQSIKSGIYHGKGDGIITEANMNNMIHEELTYKIIVAGREVHKELGPGYLESVYEDALCYELNALKMAYQRQQDLDVNYKDVVFERRFRADLFV